MQRKGILLAVCLAAADAAESRPNILFILTDDMGYGDPGCYGGKLTPTPNMDRLAREGIRFTQYCSASPICSPSRTGATTGMFPARWRITSYLQTRTGNRGCEQADFLDPRAPSLARALKAAGYATAHIGKWHMGGGRDVADAPPFAAYGFDEHAGTWESPQPHPDITAGNWIWSPKDKVKRRDRTAFFVDKTLDFLRRHQDRPCYVNLWPDDVHTPWVPADDAPKGDTPENLRRVLAEYDRQLGRLLAGLKELGIAGRTLVVFTSDNGPLPTFRGERAGGLRGSKLSLYEGGVREPLIVRWPGRTPAGRVDERTVLNAVDLFPTFCAVAGVPLPGGVVFDGEDLSAAWLGKPVTRAKPLFWEYGRNDKAFKFPEGPDRSPNVAVRDGRWKLLVNADGSGAELYDLADDPNETNNLATGKPDMAARLTAQALAWRQSLPTPPPRP
ncbi:MAG: sulfatase-like hydrolase/transferase [Verrucomicrobia bacterium]|nr:sulfatase-like hydrolase/transferase [Verrucomicrobiota bacterium]